MNTNRQLDFARYLHENWDENVYDRDPDRVRCPRCSYDDIAVVRVHGKENMLCLHCEHLWRFKYHDEVSDEH